MGKTCIVIGCDSVSLRKKDIGFFKFPTDKLIKQQWRDQLNMKRKRVTATSQICSAHFDTTDYKVSRGKWTLNKDAVPIKVQVEEKKVEHGPPSCPTEPPDRLQPPPEESPKKYSLRSRHKYSSIIDPQTSSESEHVDSEGSDTESDSDVPLKSRLHNTEDPKSADKDTIEKKYEETSEEVSTNADKTIIQSENPNRDKSIQDSNRTDTNSIIHLDANEPIDYESLIAQSNLINNKLLHKVSEPTLPVVFVQKVIDEPAPVSPDCQMLIENVQVDIDPSALFMEDDPSTQSNDEDVQIIPNAPADPVSLLTSSDEDEVIIEEPVIPLVEVSDETDEEDMPLNRLHDKTKAARDADQETKRKAIKSILLKGSKNAELYCFTCGFTTFKRSEFNTHMKDHLKPTRVRTIEVCHYCGFSTCSKDALLRHFRKHRHEKRFQCSLCDYKAKHKMSLIYHMKTHNLDNEDKEDKDDKSNKDKPVDSKKRKFECVECDFETSNSVSMKKHSRKHRTSSGDEYRPGD